MPEKKSTTQPVKAAVHDAATAEDHVVPPEGKAPAAEPAKKPAGSSAAARMMTRSIAVKKTTGTAKGDAQRTADAVRPSQIPGAAVAGRPGRRGASKGR